MESINNSGYDLELDKVVAAIKKQKASRVLIQLPDGLKPEATQIAEQLENKTKAQILIWLSSCFGACDTPVDDARAVDVDLIVQWGHSAWNFSKN